MPDKEPTSVQTTGFKVLVKIAKLDYTADLKSIQIISNMVNAYPTVKISILLDPTDIIRERIYDKESIMITIQYKGNETVDAYKASVIDEFNLELVSLTSASAFGVTKEQAINKTREKKEYEFTTVPKKSFETISATVNDVFIGKTIKEILEKIVKDKSQSKLVLDTENLNTEVIPQVLIPPTTLYKSIQFLDDRYGIFKGACNLGFCSYDNMLYVSNLSARMNKNQTFTVYQLAVDSTENENIIKKCVDGEHFYCYTDIVSKYHGNTVFAAKAMKNVYIYKPLNALFSNYELNTNDVCQKYGLISSNKNIDYNPMVENRVSYKNTFLGNSDGTDHYASTARLARQVALMSTVNIRLERNLPLMNLMKVGETVKFDPMTIDYADYSGKYILKASDISLTKPQGNWKPTATIILCRTNKTI